MVQDQKKPRSAKERTLATSWTGISDSYPGGAYILARGPGANAVTISTGCSRSVSAFPESIPGESNEKSTTEYCRNNGPIAQQKMRRIYIPYLYPKARHCGSGFDVNSQVQFSIHISHASLVGLLSRGPPHCKLGMVNGIPPCKRLHRFMVVFDTTSEADYNRFGR